MREGEKRKKLTIEKEEKEEKRKTREIRSGQ